MKDSRVLSDLNDAPDETPSIHPWTRPHGGKHRDYSAPRLQTRERARLRVQQAIQEERDRARQRAQTRHALEPSSAEGEPVPAVSPADAVAVEPSAAPLASLPAPEPAATAVGEPFAEGVKPDRRDESAPLTHRTRSMAEDMPSPAWLTADRAELTVHSLHAASLHAASVDTLQGARDRLASRWFALKGMFEGAVIQDDELPARALPAASGTPMLAVFSLGGGVGKSSLAATLTRVLSAAGERVLLVETTAYGLLPFFFGARERRPGVLRTFTPPEPGSDAPVQMLTIDGEKLAAKTQAETEAESVDPLCAEIMAQADGASRIVVDIATASAAAYPLLRLSPLVLVPMIPDMNAVVNAASVESFFQRNRGTAGTSAEVYYVLNQFDPSLPLHIDVREVLRERLGSRLLPFALRRSPAVGEALAEGMTVLDYAPASPITQDFISLGAWIKTHSAPAGAAGRGARWVEQ